MRGLGYRAARPEVATRAVAVMPDESATTFEVAMATEGAAHRVAASTLEGLQLNYLDTFGILPGFSGSSYKRFMTIPGAWRASVMLSDLFGGTPWHTYRESAEGNMVRTARNALILDQPAGSLANPVEVRSSWSLDYMWNGNAIGIYVTRDINNRPDSILPIPAELAYVREVTDSAHEPDLTVPPGTIQYLIGGRTFTQDEIFHVKGPHAPGDLRGMGVLELALAPGSAIRLAMELDRQAGQIAASGVPTGTLKSSNPEATQKQLKAAKRAWLESQRLRTVAALGPNIEFAPVAWNPEDMQLIEARKFSLTQLELIFGLPVGWLGGSTSSRTYSNIEQDAVNLIKFSTLAGLFPRFEWKFTSLIPRGQVAMANLDAILRGDTLTRYQAHTIATGGRAWQSPDDVRRTENMPPMGGDAALLEPAQPAAPADPAMDPMMGDNQS